MEDDYYPLLVDFYTQSNGPLPRGYVIRLQDPPVWPDAGVPSSYPNPQGLLPGTQLEVLPSMPGHAGPAPLRTGGQYHLVQSDPFVTQFSVANPPLGLCTSG